MNYKAKAVIDNRTCENCKARDGKIIDHLPGSYICTSEDGCRCVAMPTEELTPAQKYKPTHGGKRPGSGRKPIDSPVDNRPIYCGDIEKELREAVMDLDPKARKFALASLVKMEMARCTNDRGLFIVALRDVIRDWEGMQL